MDGLKFWNLESQESYWNRLIEISSRLIIEVSYSFMKYLLPNLELKLSYP